MVNFSENLKKKFLEYGVNKYKNVDISMPNYIVRDGEYIDNNEFVYNNVFMPLIDASKNIYFKQYEPGWRDLVPKNSLPKWQHYLDENINIFNFNKKLFVLKKQAALSSELKNFWFDSSVSWNEEHFDQNQIYNPSARKYYRVADVIIEVNKDSFPFYALQELSKAGFYWKSSFIDNPFAALKRSTRSWILGNIYEDTYLCPYRGLDCVVN